MVTAQQNQQETVLRYYLKETVKVVCHIHFMPSSLLHIGGRCGVGR
jgi:ketopantoate hydroxymethyltransferase